MPIERHIPIKVDKRQFNDSSFNNAREINIRTDLALVYLLGASGSWLAFQQDIAPNLNMYSANMFPAHSCQTKNLRYYHNSFHFIGCRG